jgi:hypothetical protein
MIISAADANKVRDSSNVYPCVDRFDSRLTDVLTTTCSPKLFQKGDMKNSAVQHNAAILRTIYRYIYLDCEAETGPVCVLCEVWQGMRTVQQKIYFGIEILLSYEMLFCDIAR